MPKAKFKRKGATVPLPECPPKRRAVNHDVDFTGAGCASASISEQTSFLDADGDNSPCSVRETRVSKCNWTKTLTDLPEEIICLILARSDIRTIAAVEATCKYLRKVLFDARTWRKIFLHKLEFEPGLRAFLSDADLRVIEKDEDLDQKSYKRMFGELQKNVNRAWRSNLPPNITRSNFVYGQKMENHILCQIMTSGRYFVAFYGTQQNSCASLAVDIIDIFDRNTEKRVRRVQCVPSKMDIFRIVEELGLFFLTHPGLLKIKMIRLNEEDDCLDLSKPGEIETGRICDIVIRDYISIRGTLHRRVAMVAMNTESLQFRHYHIGELQFFSISEQGDVCSVPLCKVIFNPVRFSFGRFFNQCIQKKGLSDFNDEYAIVVVGGCEGSAVLGVVNMDEEKLIHRLQLRDPSPGAREGECERGLCQCRVVSLLIDKTATDSCAVLLSTGQLIVIHLPTGNTLFHKRLQFDGQLKLALHQPGLLDSQRIAIKFRNYVSFYDLIFSKRTTDIKLNHVRTVLITSLTEGRETRLDDNPSQELRRQFGELQRSIKALHQYSSGIQEKIDKGLRPGTVTQGVISVAKKVQLVTNKLDQAHGKAREIEAVVIGSIAFDNRFCHALTLNRDLVSIDLAGALEATEAPKKPNRKVKGEKSSDGGSRRRTRQSTADNLGEPSRR